MKHLTHFYSDGHEPTNIARLLTEKENEVVKEVIQKIKFLSGFDSNINSKLTRKGDFGGVKTHDWHIFINV